MIRTTYFGGLGTELAPADADAVVGVVRRPKEFVHNVVDRNEPALGPPESLLDAYKRVVDAAEADGHPQPRAVAWRSAAVEQQYREHLTRRRPRRVLAALREQYRASSGDTVLVCWERDVRHCHWRPLAEVLADGLDGVDVTHHPTPETVAAEVDAERAADGPTEATLADFGGERP